ncbi:MAG: serine/threonine-protein kinase, partial [Planctomycetaceae bacterium]
MPPIRLTPDVFVGLIRQSKLVDEVVLKSALREMLSLAGVTKDPVKIADELVNRKLLTRWQADKLLQGRNKGFFLGKYKLLSHLGRGGAGAVYLAEHSLMERRVAIKVLPRDNAGQATLLARFRREAQALAALDHPNIVRANDIDQDGQVHFLVMEYVAGKSLQELVEAEGPVSPVAAAEYIRQAAEGLHHAHKAGMVHRDIKPANLLLSDRGVVKLLDLGLARICNQGTSSTVTRQGQQLGTVDYMSPEQIRDPAGVDARGDLYSLGCTLYFLLVG